MAAEIYYASEKFTAVVFTGSFMLFKLHKRLFFFFFSKHNFWVSFSWVHKPELSAVQKEDNSWGRVPGIHLTLESSIKTVWEYVFRRASHPGMPIHCHELRKYSSKPSLAVQRLRFHTPNAGVWVCPVPQLKVPQVGTFKILSSQTAK